MRTLAPTKAPLNLLDPTSFINSGPWLEWFQRITDYYNEALRSIDAGTVDYGSHEPSNPREGLLAFADGINWDPGHGAGYYYYEAGGWIPLGVAFADTVVTETSFGQTATAGTANNSARGDHTHGTPIDPIPAHIAAPDPHVQYQKEVEKGAPNGYASLDSSTLVPLSQLLSGTPNGEKFFADDRTWQKPEYFQVGSLYGTLTYFNPATVLGYGTWVLIAIT